MASSICRTQARRYKLGTREVEDYSLPNWVFDKILYIEKRGVWEALKGSGMAERYDMAVISAQGYATEAARLLLSRAEKGRKYRIFAFHDADLSGYNIARTLAEETKRMPGYSVEVHDIGLKLQEAIEEMHLETEPHVPKKPPAKVVAQLTDFERDVFMRRHKRVELNAILPADRAGYIERKLREWNATEKVVPPDEVLRTEGTRAYENRLMEAVEELVREVLNVEGIKRDMRGSFVDEIPDDLRAAVLAAFEENREQSWREAVETRAQERIDERHNELRAGVTASITEALR